MYVDNDNRGLISIFEIDRSEWSALRSACKIAALMWEIQLAEFNGLDPARMSTYDIQRRSQLTNYRDAVQKLAFGIAQASERIDQCSIPNPFTIIKP